MNATAAVGRLGGFVAVHLRHSDIEQHDLGSEGVADAQRFDPVEDGADVMAGELELQAEGGGGVVLRSVPA